MTPGRVEESWPGVPRVRQERYTIFPNVLLDRLLPYVTQSEWKIVSGLVRRTYGWDREGDSISSRQFVDLTGMDRSTVRRALARLVERGVIQAVQGVAPEGDSAPTYYRFVYEDEVQKGGSE